MVIHRYYSFETLIKVSSSSSFYKGSIQQNFKMVTIKLYSYNIILRFENNRALVLKFLLNWPQEKVSEANGYVAVNFLFQLIFVFALFQIH